MATDFPTNKQTIPNPTGIEQLENATPELDHDYQHSTVNDTIEALQDKVGVDGSAVTTSHDYKLSEVTGSDKAVSKTATQTLTNKTLTSPKINLGSDAEGDIYDRDSSGALRRIAIGANNTVLTSNGTSASWQTSPATTDASESDRGVSRVGTQPQVDNGTDTVGTDQLFVEPSKLRAKKYHDYAVTTGSANAYVLDVTPSITTYTVGQEFTFEANFTNTGSATLNVDGLGAQTIKLNSGATLAGGEIISGGIYKVVYDGTDMLIQGISELSTNTTFNSVPTSDTFYTYQMPILANLDGWTQSGTVIVTGGAAVADVAFNPGEIIYTRLPGSGTQTYWQPQEEKQFTIKCPIEAETSTSTNIGVGLVNLASVGDIDADETSTTASIRFLSTDDASTLFAITANGSSVTATDISAFFTTKDEWNTYTIKYESPTSVKFYVNGVLAATHTTNIPTGTGNYVFGVGCNGNISMSMKPFTISIEN